MIIKQSPWEWISQSLKEQLIKPNVSPFAYLNFHFLGTLPGHSHQGGRGAKPDEKRPFISFRTSYRCWRKGIDFSFYISQHSIGHFYYIFDDKSPLAREWLLSLIPVLFIEQRRITSPYCSLCTLNYPVDLFFFFNL